MEGYQDRRAMHTFSAVVERCPETGLLVGYVPDFPGAHSQSETLDELQINLQAPLPRRLLKLRVLVENTVALSSTRAWFPMHSEQSGSCMQEPVAATIASWPSSSGRIFTRSCPQRPVGC